MKFKDFAKVYRYETFMTSAFNEEQNFDAFLDDPECEIDDFVFDKFWRIMSV